jgi:hypothetical protein
MVLKRLQGETVAYTWLLSQPYLCEGCGEPVVGHACIPTRYLTGDNPCQLTIDEAAHIWHTVCAWRAGADLSNLDSSRSPEGYEGQNR